MDRITQKMTKNRLASLAERYKRLRSGESAAVMRSDPGPIAALPPLPPPRPTRIPTEIRHADGSKQVAYPGTAEVEAALAVADRLAENAVFVAPDSHSSSDSVDSTSVTDENCGGGAGRPEDPNTVSTTATVLAAPTELPACMAVCNSVYLCTCSACVTCDGPVSGRLQLHLRPRFLLCSPSTFGGSLLVGLCECV